MKLLLPRELRIRIEEQARAAFPGECCGLMEGICGDGAARALTLHPARNVAARHDRFEIHPEDHFAALKAARAGGHSLIGCYHSHPNGTPEPSATDKAGAGEENFFWLIAALAKAAGPVTLAAYRYAAAAFISVELTGAGGADFVTSPAGLREPR
jgi:proteasome lid subunit RPN8/RPN11